MCASFTLLFVEQKKIKQSKWTQSDVEIEVQLGFLFVINTWIWVCVIYYCGMFTGSFFIGGLFVMVLEFWVPAVHCQACTLTATSEID